MHLKINSDMSDKNYLYGMVAGIIISLILTISYIIMYFSFSKGKNIFDYSSENMVVFIILFVIPLFLLFIFCLCWFSLKKEMDSKNYVSDFYANKNSIEMVVQKKGKIYKKTVYEYKDIEKIRIKVFSGLLGIQCIEVYLTKNKMKMSKEEIAQKKLKEEIFGIRSDDEYEKQSSRNNPCITVFKYHRGSRHSYNPFDDFFDPPDFRHYIPDLKDLYKLINIKDNFENFELQISSLTSGLLRRIIVNYFNTGQIDITAVNYLNYIKNCIWFFLITGLLSVIVYSACGFISLYF